ncbi:hypothetical protein LAV82_23730 [Bacillus sp. ILBB4]|nr:hypothetical protein [Bacillus sp. ILBB4]
MNKLTDIPEYEQKTKELAKKSCFFLGCHYFDYKRLCFCWLLMVSI